MLSFRVSAFAGLALMWLPGAACGQNADASFGPPRAAIVIGDGSYAQAPVVGSVSDARAVAEVLRQGGFDVVYAENAGKLEIAAAVNKFAKKLKQGVIAIVYYSGHAIQYQGRNFLVPIDAKIDSEGDISRETVDVDPILDNIVAAGPTGSAVILDASRDNPWQQAMPGHERGLAPHPALQKVVLAYPTAPGNVVSPLMSGIFSAELVKAMKTPGLGIEAVLSRTRASVMRASENEEVPWDSSAPLVDFVITQLRAPVAPTVPVPIHASIRDCEKCPELVLIPAGSFKMGSTEGFGFERPVHEVSIQKPFLIGLREVTLDEWDSCVADGGCDYQPSDHGLGRGLRPVTDVDWNDAKSFVSWLSRKTGRTYRLPTESEWEYAARAGSTTTYYWGQAVEKDRANCIGCTTKPTDNAVVTGSFLPNAFGLFDMAGNAAEWVEDCWNDSYRDAPSDGSAWTAPQCRERVLRGGSFNNDPRYLQSAARFKYDNDVRFYANGFRVVREN